MKIVKARVKYYYRCEYLAFYDMAKSYPTPIYGALSVTRSQKARYVLYRSMLLDLVIAEGSVGRTLVLTRDGTSSKQNLGPSGPQRIDFMLCN